MANYLAFMQAVKSRNWHLILESFKTQVQTDITAVETEITAARDGQASLLAKNQAQDSAISGIQTEVQIARGSTSSLNARLSAEHNPNGTHAAGSGMAIDWKIEGNAVAYVSATVFDVVGIDLTAVYKGRKILAGLTAGPVYGMISSSATSGSNTRVTLKNIVDANGAAASLDNTLSFIKYSNICIGHAGAMPDGNIWERLEELTLSLFVNYVKDLLGRGENAISAEGSFWDAFQSSAASGTMLDLSVSTGVEYDGTSKCWKNYAAAAGAATPDIISVADAAKWEFEDVKGTAVKFVVDTANVSGHFADAANAAVSIGIGNAEPKIRAGCRFKISGVEYTIKTITGTGTAANDIAFSGGNIAAATYTVTSVFGACVESTGVISMTSTGVGSHRYYRFRRTDAGGTESGYYNEMELYDDAGKITVTSGMVTLTNLITQGDGLPGLVDGNPNTLSCYPQAGAIIKIDLGAGNEKNVTQARFYIGIAGSTSTWAVEYSDNDSIWSTAYAGFSFPGVSNAWTQYANLKAYPDDYYSFCVAAAGQTDIRHFTNIISAAVSETLNEQNIWYYFSFDGGAVLKIYNAAGSVMRSIARNNAGTWQYNNNAANDSAETWVNSTVNAKLSALSQAVSAQAANRMTGTQLAGIGNAAWEGPGGFVAGTSNTLDFGGVLKTGATSSTPTLSNISFTYDCQTSAVELRSRVWDGVNNAPDAPANADRVFIGVIDKQISGTPVYEVSRDGGATWKAVSAWTSQNTDSAGKSTREAVINMSAEPAGLDPRCRIRTALGNDYKLYALTMSAGL